MPKINSRQFKNKTGFTLIELLVVIAIIGILAGMVVINMSGATDSAKIAKSKVFSSSVRSSLLMNRVSEWNFDEGAGTAVADTVGTNNGVLNNFNFDLTDGWRTGSSCVSEGCLQFDGTNDYVSMGSQISLGGDYSVEAWVNIPSSVSGAAVRYLISFGASNTSLPAFAPCYSNQYKPLIYLNSSSYRYGRTDLRDGKWHHIVFIVAGGEMNNILNAKIYIDGKEDSYYATTNTQVPIAPTGNGWMGGGNYPGLADGVRVYNKQLTISRIREEYLSGLEQLSAKGLVAKEEYEQRSSDLNLNYAENK
jgi:prepilin-type N-terminal cleavage/methylation domain-containing protein